MRIPLLLVLAASAFACGGGAHDAQRGPSAPPAPPAAAPIPRTAPPAARTAPTRPPAAAPRPAAPAAPTRSGKVVEVRMTGNGRDHAAFEPNRLTIAPGTTVRFINVSGGPHSIAFWPDSIPHGATSALNSAMPSHMGKLMSLMMTKPNETYDITFPATKGVYKGYCPPHVRIGMKFAITVR